MSSIKNFLIFTVSSFLFFVSGFAIPFMGIFFLPMSSVSVVLLFIKNGILSGLLGIVISTAAIYRFVPAGPAFSFVFISFVVLNALFLYSGVKRKKYSWRTIADSCIAVSFVAVAIISLFVLGGFDISWIFEKIAAGLPKDVSSVVAETIVKNIYSITVIFIIIAVTLSYVFLAAAAGRFSVEIKKMPAFEKWRFPETFIFAVIISLLLFIVFKQINNPVFFQVSENILNVVYFLYFTAGLSIGKHFFNKSKIMQALAYAVFLLYPPSAIFLGISDVWLDFRKKKEDKKDEGYPKEGD